jgi:hypothetical protein
MQYEFLFEKGLAGYPTGPSYPYRGRRRVLLPPLLLSAVSAPSAAPLALKRREKKAIGPLPYPGRCPVLKIEVRCRVIEGVSAHHPAACAAHTGRVGYPVGIFIDPGWRTAPCSTGLSYGAPSALRRKPAPRPRRHLSLDATLERPGSMSLLHKSRGSAGGAPSPERSRLPEPCGGQVGASADSPASLDWSPVLQDAAKLAALLSEFCKLNRKDHFF